MAQKTTLTFDKIVEYLGDAVEPQTGEEAETLNGYPLCLLVNELGEIFSAGGANAVAAERKLVEILGHQNDAARWIAYRYLQDSTQPLSRDGAAKFAAFCENPDNVRIVERV